jgi:DNA-binding response OmpR family regulator
MDGIETTKKLREMGYDEPIVALTANAVAGQAEIFLNNGFNDFLSKPIDIRQMNNTLNKLIRDKQPPEVIEAARNEFNTRHNTKPKSKSVNDPAMIEAFVRDAQKALKTLEEIMHRNDYNDENNLRTYVINVHGIKNPLINMGRAELSASAMKLESAGRDKNFDVIITETPAFITSLKALVTELTPEEAQPEEEIKDDVMLLREKLAAIKNACGEYDRKTANDSIDELKNTKWSKSVKDLLYEISECLLHSDFEEAESKIDSYKTESGLDL